MRILRLATAILLFSTAAIVLSGCGTGNGTVYVGVGVAGPWGYPPGRGGYYPRPGYGGRPCCWDDDAQDVEVQDLDWALQDLFDGVYWAPEPLMADPDWMERLR